MLEDDRIRVFHVSPVGWASFLHEIRNEGTNLVSLKMESVDLSSAPTLFSTSGRNASSSASSRTICMGRALLYASAMTGQLSE